MVTVAIVGGDGAGKTSIARRLVEEDPIRFRYLYMGMNPQSSNLALPTSRLVYAWKLRRVRGNGVSRSAAGATSLHSMENRRDRRGPFLATVRLFNRLAEEIVRQIASEVLQVRGFIVIYDRHFLFDHTHSGSKRRRLTDRIHLFFLERIYPKPTLTVFLDAPPEILYERTREVPVSYLANRRRVFLEVGASLDRFVTVDADRPPDIVFKEVRETISGFFGEQSGRSRAGRRRRGWEKP